jgi:hypothetical protein
VPSLVATRPKRDGIGVYVANIRIVGAAYFHLFVSAK